MSVTLSSDAALAAAAFLGGDSVAGLELPGGGKRRSVVAGLQHQAGDGKDASDPDWEGDSGSSAKKTKASKDSATKKKGTDNSKINGKTVEQHRTSLRLKVARNIKVAGGPGKWHCKATCHAEASLSTEAFRAVVAGAADSITPAVFNSNTDVVVAEVRSHEKARAVLGHGSGQLSAGTRYVWKDGSSSSWQLEKMDLVFKPKTKELNMWWTMDGGH
jgi:hypothetical protein